MPLEFPIKAKTAKLPTWTLYLWIALCLGCCTRALLFPTSHTVYHNYAGAGRCWLGGVDAYDLERDQAGGVSQRMSGYRYAPLVSILFVPFSLLPDGLGGALWRLVSFACFLGAFAWFQKTVLPGARELGDTAKAALWLLLVPLCLGSMNNGQANVLLMGLLLAAGAAVVAERWNLAAALLAGACFLKIYPLAIALLLLVVYPGRLGWRFILAMSVGLALPLVLQDPDYVVGQYANWFQLLANDDRRDFPLNQGYRFVEFHTAICAATGNRRLQDLFSGLRPDLQRIFLFAVNAMTLEGPDGAGPSLAEHETILKAIEAGNGKAAADGVVRHFAGRADRIAEALGG